MLFVLYYGDFEFEVESCYQDILEFEFYKTFNENYSPILGMLTEEQRKFIVDFNKKWFYNQIYEFDYYTTRNLSFLNFLKEKYEDEAGESVRDDYLDQDPDEWWDNLCYSDKKQIMEDYNAYY